MPEVRSLNDVGVAQLRAFLLTLKSSPTAWPPPDILYDPACSEAVPGVPTIEPREFDSKLAFGRYAHDQLRGVPDVVLRTSLGLWSWLTLFYVDQVCPPDGNGRRKVLSLEKYLPSTGHISKGLDKHLLFFPWKMVSLHGSHVEWLLGGALREDTKVVRELANSYRRNVSTPFLELAKALYFDDSSNKVRRGATTNRAGSLRRLDRILSQLDLTFDVFGLDASELKSLLPEREFARWLGKAR